MNQLAKLYQTKCIQLQEQIENLERLLEAAQTSPLSDAQWAETLKAAQEKQAEEVKQEEEKKKAEEAAKPKKPDTAFSRFADKYAGAEKFLKGFGGTLVAMQALPRWGGEKGEKGTATTIQRTIPGEKITQVSPDVQVKTNIEIPTEPKVIPGKESKAGSLTGKVRIPFTQMKWPIPTGLVYGVAERADVRSQNRSLPPTVKAAEDLLKAEDALRNIPALSSTAQQRAWGAEAVKDAETALSKANLTRANRLSRPSVLGTALRLAGGAAAAAAEPGLLPATLDILGSGTKEGAKHLLGAAPAVLPAQGMVGSEVAAKAKDLAAKTAAKAASAGGKALSVLSPVETIASEVAGIGARALGLGAEVAGAAALAPLAIGAITRSAGGTEMRGSIEGMPFPPGVNSMEEYDKYLEKQRKQQNASAVQSLVGRGYNPEGRSATQRQ